MFRDKTDVSIGIRVNVSQTSLHLQAHDGMVQAAILKVGDSVEYNDSRKRHQVGC